MKTRTILFISALLALTSCGSAARFASDASRQKYQDGIYYTSNAKVHQAEEAATSANDEETDLLVAKTKNSPIFMKSGEKVDTLFIPENRLPTLVRDILVFLEPSFLHLDLLGRESLVLWWLVLTVAL